MRIVDFDAKFFAYVQRWVAAHPEVKPEEIEDHYNEMMGAWLTLPADWLDGKTPGSCFDGIDDPAELIGLMEGYAWKKINLPEPLYSRIVSMGDRCAAALLEIFTDAERAEALRSEALGMLRDMGSTIADSAMIEMICGCAEKNELCEMAAEILATRGAETAARLLDAYPGATEYAQQLILDVCANLPGDGRTLQYLLERIRATTDSRALYASYLAKLGDPGALELLGRLIRLSDLSYFDYIEIRNAIEALGGDPGEERTFYGDPDYEAMRNL